MSAPEASLRVAPALVAGSLLCRYLVLSRPEVFLCTVSTSYVLVDSTWYCRHLSLQTIYLNGILELFLVGQMEKWYSLIQQIAP